ncbi:MAG TPA: DUF892 family protein [Daejeonella sp.]|nr:DUF892 family protein [Daejeonella sp.]
MKKNNSILPTGFLKSSEGFINQDIDQYVQNLKAIYSAESYCLKRLPRLVNMISQSDLESMLSDHTSVIMDRLNRLDHIAKELKLTIGRTQNPTFKNIISKMGKIIHHFNIYNPQANYELISILLEVSIYRSYIYNALLQAMNETNFPETTAMMQRCVNEEDFFFNNLLKTKMYIRMNEHKTTSMKIEPVTS